MCGIIGIVGAEPVADRLLDGLKRLEYRGYDSAGIATIVDGRVERRRAPGKLKNLAARLVEEPIQGDTGIAHTRWATHGAPTEDNAHPHVAGDVTLVHNGIIENFKPLRDELLAEGVSFASQTDSEVVAHLIARELKERRLVTPFPMDMPSGGAFYFVYPEGRAVDRRIAAFRDWVLAELPRAAPA